MSAERHFLAMSFPALGHIIPMIELLKKIRQKHYKVTYAVSAAKLPAIKTLGLLPEDIPLIALEDGLAEDYDKDLLPQTFRSALDKTFVPQKALLESLPRPGRVTQGKITTPVDGIILDIEYFTILQLCHDNKIPVYLFCTGPAWTFTSGLDVTEDTPTVPDDYFFRGEETPADSLIEYGKEYHLTLNKNLRLVKAVIVNSVEELDKNNKATFLAHPNSAGTPMRFVGPLYPKTDVANPIDEKVNSWLDKQRNRSVVYVSFGSMAMPDPKQIEEIAHGLLDLKKPFIWSLKSSEQQHLPNEFRRLMAKGFNGDFLVLPWAPQKIILAHPSIELFVSHCGWNSILEGLSKGIPFVCWPMFVDQFLNADLMVQLGAGIKIPNTSVKATRIVPRNELTSAILKITEKTHNGEKSSYEKAARELAIAISSATAEGGTSYVDFELLFG